MASTLKNNCLSIVLIGLFLLTLGGQYVTGWYEHNEDQRRHRQPETSFAAYAGDGHFLEAVFENWESEFLQMAAFVILTVFLFQKGSPESKDPDSHDEVDDDPARRSKPIPPNAPKAVRAGGWRLRLYEHSLSLALLLLFVLSFWVHAWSSLRHYNGEREEHGDPPLTMSEHLARSRFWFESFQNWQSEFLSIAVLVVFSVFLRQRGSSQSKPVATPHLQNE